MSDQRIDYERLIVRRLDGVITDDEALELDRELLRNPELHRMLEAYEGVDALAASALISAIGDRTEVFDPSILNEPRRVRWMRRRHRGWLLIPGAIAAALLAVVIPKGDTVRDDPPGDTRPRYTSLPIVENAPRSMPGQSGLMHNVSTMKRNTGRDIIGVVGEDGNIYWIEVDRTRTIKLPPRSRYAPEQL